MGKFAAGLLVGLIMGALGGAAIAWLVLRPAPAPTPEAIPAAQPDKPGPRKGGPRKPRTAQRAGDAPDPLDAPAVQLSAADLRAGSDGDTLRAAAATLDMGAAGEARDLTQDEIDGTFGGKAEAMIRCITDAHAGAAMTGRVLAGVVVGADGRVVKTRIEAPTWLLRHGLYSCARSVLLSLRFPATGKETVVTVPFDVSE